MPEIKLDLKEGKTLVSLARETVERCLSKGQLILKKFDEEFLKQEASCFVTILTLPEKRLRGCIGFVSPMQLGKAVQRAAYAAALKDPRFPQIKREELKNIIFEISILTEPQSIDGKSMEDYCKKIKIGEDGLIIQCSEYSGLLLPNVATEQRWDEKEFLQNLCYKAGLTPHFIENENTKIWKFQTQLFIEKEPSGDIEIVQK